MKVLIILALATIPCWLLWSHLKAVKAEDEARAARLKAAAAVKKKATAKKKRVTKKKAPAKKRGRPRKKKKSENTDGKK